MGLQLVGDYGLGSLLGVILDQRIVDRVVMLDDKDKEVTSFWCFFVILTDNDQILHIVTRAVTQYPFACECKETGPTVIH